MSRQQNKTNHSPTHHNHTLSFEAKRKSEKREQKAMKRAYVASLWVWCLVSALLLPASLAQQPPAPSAVADTYNQHSIDSENEMDSKDLQERSLSWLFPGRAPTATHIEFTMKKKMYTKWKQKWNMNNPEQMYTKWKKKFQLWSNPAPPEPPGDDYYSDSQDDDKDDQGYYRPPFPYGQMYQKGYDGESKGYAGAKGNGGYMYWGHHHGQMKWKPPPGHMWRGKWYKEKHKYPKPKPPSFFPMFSPPRPPAPHPPSPSFPTPIPPYPTPSPPFPTPAPQTFSVDFSSASLLNPSVYLAVAEVGTQVIVDLSLPLQQGQLLEVYLVENRDVGMGSVCPPAGGFNILIAPGQTFVSVGLTNNDSVVAVCVDNVVVGNSYFAFETAATINGGSGNPNAEFPDAFTEVADFSDVSLVNPLLYSIQFGPGVSRPDPGTLFMYGSRAAGSPGRNLFVDAFYTSPRGPQVVVGSTCPLPGDQFLQPDELFPFTLYQVGGTKDQLIFACNAGVVVGIVDLLYVPNTGPFYRRQEVDCLGGGGRGYDSLTSLNEDILFERNRILAGGIPEPAYYFTLCPNSPFDANVPLRPALDNVFISCGQSSGPQSTCALVGGGTQVDVETHADSLFPVGSITLSGLTFTGFSYAAIAGRNIANDMTTIFVQDSVFSTNAAQGFLIDQSTPVGRPFSVVVQNCTVEDVNLSVGFANNRGSLTIDTLTVATSNIVGALVSANGISGVLTISGLNVFECFVSDVVLVLDGATADIYQIRVSAMTGIGRIIDVAGLGTTVSVREAKILDNIFTRIGEDWIGLRVLDSASLTVNDSRFSNNAGSEAMFWAGRGGQLTMERVDVVGSIGALPINNALYPAVIRAENAVVFHRDSLIEGISSYTAVYFAIFAGSIDITRVCINGNQADAAVFVSSDSIYQVAGNAIDNVDSTVCPNSAISGPPGISLGRLAKERQGSNCFSNGAGICEVDCAPFAQYALCTEIPGYATRGTGGTSQTLGNGSLVTTYPPSATPSLSSTAAPSRFPSTSPSSLPSDEPSGFPSALPSLGVAEKSGGSQTESSAKVAQASSKHPTSKPSESPSVSSKPSTNDSTEEPSSEPTSTPSTSLTTMKPTLDFSTEEPTVEPTSAPSSLPTTIKPTLDDSTEEPTSLLTPKPSSSPSTEPTAGPTQDPSAAPSTKLTAEPTSKPSSLPSSEPTVEPTSMPSSSLSVEPTAISSSSPAESTPLPSQHPSEFPSLFPSQIPSNLPSEASAE